jgi:RNA polymerase primary sigma factor
MHDLSNSASESKFKGKGNTMKSLKKKTSSKAALSKAAGGKKLTRSEPTPLSFTDLEIPVGPLLTREQEARSGRIIQSSLKRLARLLPRHPAAYRRFLARMQEVATGSSLVFTWMAVRERMADDLMKARQYLERTESLATKDPAKALQAFEAGAAVLGTYPLDPETLFQWAREAVNSKIPEHLLHKLPKLERIGALASRLLRRLDRERDNLVLPNFRLVLKEVFRYHPTGMRRSDLFQEGVLGLHKAVFRFDAERATRFSTYATYWIRQSIRKALIDKSRLIRVPQAVQEELRKQDSSLAPEEADRVRRIMTETMLFSAGESDDSGDRNTFVVEDPSVPELGEELHTGVIPRLVSDALESLETREREVLQRRFGLGGEKPQTLEEIGTRMNLSRERIRQIEREALGRMRKLTSLRDVYEDLDLVSPVGPSSRN